MKKIVPVLILFLFLFSSLVLFGEINEAEAVPIGYSVRSDVDHHLYSIDLI
jgi:hypothetical protein